MNKMVLSTSSSSNSSSRSTSSSYYYLLVSTHSSSWMPQYRPSSWKALLNFITVMIVMVLLQAHGVASDKITHSDNQKYLLFKAYFACNRSISALKRPDDGGLYCEPVWDNVMCWPNYVRAGQLVQQPCADYIEGFNTNEKAHRFCMPDGTWAHHPNKSIDKPWTNFLDCAKKFTVNQHIAHHMPIINLISTVGYSISLVVLLVATAIMVGFKKLHCQRNTIHINLFLSFMLRAVISLVRNGVLVKGFAFPFDITHDEDGKIIFIKDGLHWECKLLNVLHQYALSANYAWIFVEGLYLHTLIFFAVFSQTKKFFKLYIVIGWTFPLISIIIWILLRIYKNDVLCWNTHKKNYYSVIEGPIIGLILINFFFFLNIIRVLFTKIRNCNTRDPRRFRKLAKSTLVLIPLFGVYYIIFIVLARHQHIDVTIVHLYLEMTFNSFQGIVVALLFCFFNGEVRMEIKKRWHRHWLRRYSVTSGRSSRAFSTSSFVFRERLSMSQPGPTTLDGTFNNSHMTPTRVNDDTIELAPLASNSSDTETMIPRIPSESKVTFCVKEDNNRNDDDSDEDDNDDDDKHSSSSSQKESPDNKGTPPSFDTSPLQSGGGVKKDSEYIIPVKYSKSSQPLLCLHYPSKSSNGLSLMKDPPRIRQNGIRKT